jgi:hypothetical protein
MPITIEKAKEVKDQVRLRFKGGAKSSNKLYVPANDKRDSIDARDAFDFANTWVNVKASVRAVLARPAALTLNSLKKYENRKESEIAQYLDELGHKVAGNCLQMARLTALHLPNDSSQDKYFGSLAFADHVFCIVMPKKCKKPSLTVGGLQFEQLVGWIVIDPWLNVCCEATEYPAKVQEQLNKWSGEGKRIYTPVNPLYREGEWKLYLPNGTYMNRFMQSQIILRPYI